MSDTMLEKEFSTEKRKELAKSGAALPDGSFPIENKNDLANAIKAFGRAKDPAAAKAHIKKRAKALGATDMIPDTWESWVRFGTDELVSEGSVEQCIAEIDTSMLEDDSTGEHVRTVNGHMDAAEYHDAKGMMDAHPRQELHKQAAAHHRDAAVRGGADGDAGKSAEARQASQCANGNCDCSHHNAESFKEAGKDKTFKQSDSHDGLRDKLSQAIDGKVMAGEDMDGDNDGDQDAKERMNSGYPSHYVRAVHDSHVIYSMNGKSFAHPYDKDVDGDPHLQGKPVEVEPSYTTVKKPNGGNNDGGARGLGAEAAAQQGETISESCAFDKDPATGKIVLLTESFADSGDITFTIIKPGLSKNNRYYPADMLKRDYKVFEGAKMFVNHATDREDAARPEGDINNWAANITKVWPESDGTLKANAKVIDPALKAKMKLLGEAGLLNTMGVSIRAMGQATPGEVNGHKCKVVEGFKAAKSVDFVTFAGAGGAVESLQ